MLSLELPLSLEHLRQKPKVDLTPYPKNSWRQKASWHSGKAVYEAAKCRGICR